VYSVTSDHQVLEQVAALPIEALASWNGDPVHKDNPDGAVRARSDAVAW
jgi:hypothetical protein